MLIIPRGLCKRDWAKNNEFGTCGEFNAYFKELPFAEKDVHMTVIGDYLNT